MKSRSATLLPLWWKPVRLMSYAASLAEATVRWASMLAVFSNALSPQSFRSCAQLLSTSKDIYGYFPWMKDWDEALANTTKARSNKLAVN